MSEQQQTNENANENANANSEEESQPTQIGGNLKFAQGVAYSAIGSVIPGETGNSWVQAGQELKDAGQTELNNAKQRQAVEATVDSATAKMKSAYGYVTGDQSKQTEGNIENEKAQWEYKTATQGLGAIPIPSVEGVKGKIQSVVGMVTGDQEKQMEGNTRAEKAAWTDGI